ncbi:MAG: chorismate-binding protein [Actinomycetaceae bacterium]|nr:chorismate-binding protein [Actinomycetaceae bacterium]
MNFLVQDLPPLPVVPELFGLCPASEKLSAFVGQNVAVLGIGECARFTGTGAEQILRGENWWDLLDAAVSTVPPAVRADFPITFPVALGSFAFAPEGEGALIVPQVTVVTTGVRTLACVSESTRGRELFRLLQSRANLLEWARTELAQAPAPTVSGPFPGSLTEDEWAKAVAEVAGTLGKGGAEKVVLARDLQFSCENLDQRVLAAELMRAYPTCWTFVVDNLVGATPEMLGESNRGRFRCRVLAGTAGKNGGAALKKSAKDQAEHHLAVQSARVALTGKVADLHVGDPFILQLPNLVHLATDITARIDGSVLHPVHLLHPTAAVCGTPTPVARKVLTRAEKMDRGRYAGPVGWVDASGGGQWAIALRCAEITPRPTPTESTLQCTKVRVFAGAGIMPTSDPDKEVAETRAKMQPLLAALTQIARPKQ